MYKIAIFLSIKLKDDLYNFLKFSLGFFGDYYLWPETTDNPYHSRQLCSM